MKVIKKLSAAAAVAVLAVCSTMVVPMAVSASENECLVHTLDKTNLRKSYSSMQHGYLYDIVVDEDGNEKEVYKNCVISTTKTTYDLDGRWCDFYLENAGVDTTSTHSARGL